MTDRIARLLTFLYNLCVGINVVVFLEKVNEIVATILKKSGYLDFQNQRTTNVQNIISKVFEKVFCDSQHVFFC